MIVVDTNVIAALLLDEDNTPVAKRLYQVHSVWSAPALWRSELRNVFVSHCRAGRIEWNRAAALIELAELQLADGDHLVASSEVFRFARALGLTAYDAEFAVLAEGLDLPLLTWDRELLAALPGRAVTPEEFLARS